MLYIIALFFASIFSIAGFVFALNKKDSEKSLIENPKLSSSFTFNHSRSARFKHWSVFSWVASFLTTTLAGAYLFKRTYQKPVQLTKVGQLNLLRQKLQAKRQNWLSKPRPNKISDWKQRLQSLLRRTKNK